MQFITLWNPCHRSLTHDQNAQTIAKVGPKKQDINIFTNSDSFENVAVGGFGTLNIKAVAAVG
jgi:hypothetical protein